MHPLEVYLQELAQIRASGANVKELSFYPAIKDLFDAAGKELKPKVQCVFQLKNQGAGMPDGGLFTASQLRKISGNSVLEQTPERGVIEVKSPRDDALDIAQTNQVVVYAQRYGLVLVTNLREFALVKNTTEDKPQVLESYSLAPDEEAFWTMTRHPRVAAQEHGLRVMEFLKRALLSQAELTDPKDLAWFLASYAREAHSLVDAAKDLPALDALRQSMQQALNMEFTGEKGEHFYRSTLVQTLFYGVFSAWVLWHHENPGTFDFFDWRLSAYNLKVPVIRSLFYQISDPHQMHALGLSKFLDLTGMTLNRVNRDVFFDRFDQGQAVQYFYEPFLEAYDPDLRKESGVWYTPPEIVEYMVERVDRVLREELGLPDGLADPSVYVLDPCCGTGAYPLEVLKRIAKTLQEKGDAALLGYDLKHAATNRVFGFEILPAPFVISHLQLGLFLQQNGAPLGDGERAGVYLTNALTGWEPPKGPKQHLLMPELEQERDAAEHVKRETPILVILGNPPYNAFAGVAETDEGKEMVRVYKQGLIEKWGIKKFNLDDLYVRFFRLAERRIVEQGGRGIVCFISSFSYLSDPSYVVMREHLSKGFDKIWFDCLNGDSRETGKTTPDGLPDPSVFSTETNPEGIRVGTTIGLMVRKTGEEEKKDFRFRHFWGVTKREELLSTLHNPDFNASYKSVTPRREDKFTFRPGNVSDQYMEWPRIIDLCEELPFVGLEECRGGSLIDIQIDNLRKRMEVYFNPKFELEDLKNLGYGLTETAAGFNPKIARAKALKLENFDEKRILRFTLRPFDIRWCYYTPVASLWNRPRPAFKSQCWDGNRFLISRLKSQAKPEGIPMMISSGLIDKQTISRNPGAIPFRIKKEIHQMDAFSNELTLRANLSNSSRAYLVSLGFINPDDMEYIENDLKIFELIWYHVLAIGYSPAYLNENADGIRGDWPRIPLPAGREALIHSAALGKRLAALLDSESPFPDALENPAISQIAVLCRADGKQINPQQGDLALTAGWGHAQGNTVMPGQGRVVARGQTLDIYLNENVFWKNIPQPVWDYVIGGYQVIKKWLAYRERKIMGRDLTVEEAREVTGIARRIAALIALQPALDENYLLVKKETINLD